ncbi:MAG: hypothetical protein WDN03_09960 [Rhizomicrobium sp.]
MKKVGTLSPDDQVLVVGVGGVGMMGVQFAKAMFQSSKGKDWGPLAADIDDAKLEAAKKAGGLGRLQHQGAGRGQEADRRHQGRRLCGGRLRRLGKVVRLRQPGGAPRRQGDHRRPVRRRHEHADPDVPLPHDLHRRLDDGFAGRDA